MTPKALATYRSDTVKLAKFAVSPTQVCRRCRKSRSITQYRPGSVVCRWCRGI